MQAPWAPFFGRWVAPRAATTRCFCRAKKKLVNTYQWKALEEETHGSNENNASQNLSDNFVQMRLPCKRYRRLSVEIFSAAFVQPVMGDWASSIEFEQTARIHYFLCDH